jgi:hypothetical protein
MNECIFHTQETIRVHHRTANVWYNDEQPACGVDIDGPQLSMLIFAVNLWVILIMKTKRFRYWDDRKCVTGGLIGYGR